jgi:hypothetical protein
MGKAEDAPHWYGMEADIFVNWLISTKTLYPLVRDVVPLLTPGEKKLEKGKRYFITYEQTRIS